MVLCDELTSSIATRCFEWCDERCNSVTGRSILLSAFQMSITVLDNAGHLELLCLA